jgi:hypothetical protein
LGAKNLPQVLLLPAGPAVWEMGQLAVSSCQDGVVGPGARGGMWPALTLMRALGLSSHSAVGTGGQDKISLSRAGQVRHGQERAGQERHGQERHGQERADPP